MAYPLTIVRPVLATQARWGAFLHVQSSTDSTMVSDRVEEGSFLERMFLESNLVHGQSNHAVVEKEGEEDEEDEEKLANAYMHS